MVHSASNFIFYILFPGLICISGIFIIAGKWIKKQIKLFLVGYYYGRKYGTKQAIHILKVKKRWNPQWPNV